MFMVVAAILKDSDFSEVDRAECQFTTTATILDNGSQVRIMLDLDMNKLVHVEAFSYLFYILKLPTLFDDYNISGELAQKYLNFGLKYNYNPFFQKIQFLAWSWIVIDDDTLSLSIWGGCDRWRGMV